MLYVIKKTDNSVYVMRLIAGRNADGEVVWPDPMDEIAKWPLDDRKNVQSVIPIGVSDIPEDRYFRDAWVSGEKPIDIDMAKAQSVHMEHIRKARNQKLQELDVETLKGIDVQAEKQVLRDIPQTFDLTVATTPEELKNLWPEILT